MTQACMGGWCKMRDKCRHFHARNSTEIAERLCLPGQDGVSDVFNVVTWLSSGEWNRTQGAELLRRADAFDGLMA